MDAKHRIVRFLGVLALLSGGLLNLLMIRGLILRHGIQDVWDASRIILGFAFLAYLIWVGVRAMRWSRGQEWARPASIKWGRVFLGVLMIYIEAENHIHPAPNLLKPSNEGEALGMKITAVVLVLLAGWLAVSGIVPRFKRYDGRSSC